MPPGPGETLLTTLFADVHYFFSDPSTTPFHHRFDRGSYIYLYHNPNTHTAQLEVANHAGTPDQDAFSGSLHNTTLHYSHKQPSLFTFVIAADNPIDPQKDRASQWHLPAFDPRNERKYLYPLYQVDVYLWTERDAAALLLHMQAVLPAEKLEILNAPPPPLAADQSKDLAYNSEHRDSMSPVVQQLEQTAIGTQLPLQRAGSTTSALSLPTSSSSLQYQQQPAAPGGYNPAAPAAPEPIAHREKTPPPIDDGRGTGLKAAAKYDGFMPTATQPQPPYVAQNSNQTTPQAAYFGVQHMPQQQQQPGEGSWPLPGPPRRAESGGGGMPPPPPLAQQQQPSFGPTAAPTTTQYAAFPAQSQQPLYFAGPPSLASPALPPTPSAPPAYAAHADYNPAPPLTSPGFAAQTNPMGRFSAYNYTNPTSSFPQGQPQASVPAGGAAAPAPYMPGEMHAQVYRPTAAEAKQSHAGHHGSFTKGRGDREGAVAKLEGRVEGVEKKLGGWLKRLDGMI